MGLSINYDCQCCTWQWHFREGWPLFKILNHGCSIFDNSKLVKLVIGTTHPPKNDKLEHTPKNEKCGTYPSSKKIKFEKNEKSVSHPSSNSCSLPSRHHRTSRRRAWSGHFLRQYQTIRSLNLMVMTVVVVVVDIFCDCKHSVGCLLRYQSCGQLCANPVRGISNWWKLLNPLN